jgi:hypothetical protein
MSLPRSAIHGAEGAAYRFAGHSIFIRPPLPAIEAWRSATPVELGPPPAGQARLPGQILSATAGWLAGRRRRVSCSAAADGYELEVEGAGRLSVARDGAWVEIVDRRTADPAMLEVVLGPGVTLALALRGVFCLHGSALAGDGEAVVLLGESGAGKSTLAGGIARVSDRWRQVADDVAPVTASPPPSLRTDFPQLKMPGGPPAVPAALRLAAAFVLEPAGGSRGVALAAERLPALRAALALVRHTVAARLFPPAVATRHLDSCLRIAGEVPVYRLVYPHDAGAFAAAAALLDRRRPTGERG